MVRLLFMAFALIALLGANSYAQMPVIYVTVAGSGNNDGSSWSNAKNGTQLAAVLRSMAEHSAVWIAKGVYKPHPSSRDSSFVIRSNARVFGGFAGNESMLSQRDWSTNKTILSGDIGVAGDISDNSKHVVFIENAGDSTILDGLTITLGNASGQYTDPPMEGVGGGVVNFTNANPGLPGISKPKFYNCTIKKNYAFMAGGGYCEYNFGTSSSYFYNCSFDSNFCSNNGGGYSLFLAVGGNAYPVFESTRFVNNILDTSSVPLNSLGGAISLAKAGPTAAYNTTVTINNCLFENNGARAGGAITSAKGFEFIINNTTFKKNFARSASVIYASNNNYRINNCVIDSNESVGNTMFFVTEVHNYMAVHTKKFITNSSFRYNTGNHLVDIQAGGDNTTLQIPSDSTFFTNCLFLNNALYGQIRAQAYPRGNTNTFLNNVTIYDDEQHVFQKAWDRQVNNVGMHATQTVGPGTANMFINNSIIWYPLPLIGERSFKSITQGPLGSSGGMASLTVRQTIFRSGSGSWPLEAGIDGGGNLVNEDPDFIDTAGNFKLNCGSPAVNSGLNSLYPASISSNDIDGAARIYNNVIDRGAYEQQAIAVVIEPEIIISGNNLFVNIGANYSIQNASWSLGDGTTGNGSHIDHDYLSEGTYIVCINVLTACGSKDTCFQVTIAGTSISNPGYNEDDLIKIYPNPSPGIAWITALPSDLPFTGQLFATSGKVVGEWDFTSNKTAIDLEKLPAGIYFLKLVKKGRTFKTFKILKQ